jgi:hypothetical protein
MRYRWQLYQKLGRQLDETVDFEMVENYYNRLDAEGG